MGRLPFVVQPRLQPITEEIGNEAIGVIAIERKGYLTAGEKAFLQQSAASDEVSSRLLTIVRQIGKKYKLPLEEAHSNALAVMGGELDTDLRLQIYGDYGEDLDSLTLMAVDADTRRRFVQAACMLLYRVDPDLSMDEIMGLHPDLLSELAELCQDEEIKSTQRLEELQEETETPTEILVEEDTVEALQKK